MSGTLLKASRFNRTMFDVSATAGGGRPTASLALCLSCNPHHLVSEGVVTRTMGKPIIVLRLPFLTPCFLRMFCGLAVPVVPIQGPPRGFTGWKFIITVWNDSVYHQQSSPFPLLQGLGVSACEERRLPAREQDRTLCHQPKKLTECRHASWRSSVCK